ncbi:DUF2793 domain-containing protein [Rhizorhapis sp. SPR117]|uniref:DUF2793 domain-containing protein n=1 Tax=Rhizorhapis sp. SPR117 TaxID=2912611 RepID=UPI001F1D882F|nr:DUF2793 domain-containing protein [Rhizorhapis sp. SPR117]
MSNDTTPRFAFPCLYSGQAQKEITHNEALTLIDMLVHAQAQSAALSDPPTTPATGESWIVGDFPTGEWNVHAGALACWTGGGWRFIAPRAGMRVAVLDEGLDYLYDGSAWVQSAVRPDGFYVSDVRVLGEQQAAIAAPTGGSAMDSEARTAIVAILNALQIHGLIDGGI